MLLSNILAVSFLAVGLAAPDDGRKIDNETDIPHSKNLLERNRQHNDKHARNSDKSCLRLISDTYLASLLQISPKINNTIGFRELLSLNSDGTASASDSVAGGLLDTADSSLQSYGVLRGVWQCERFMKDNCTEEDRDEEWCKDSKYKVKIRTLNFNYPTGYLPLDGGVNDLILYYNEKYKTLTGNSSYNYYPLYNTPYDTSTLKNPDSIPDARDYTFSYKAGSISKIHKHRREKDQNNRPKKHKKHHKDGQREDCKDDHMEDSKEHKKKEHKDSHKRAPKDDNKEDSNDDLKDSQKGHHKGHSKVSHKKDSKDDHRKASKDHCKKDHKDSKKKDHEDHKRESKHRHKKDHKNSHGEDDHKQDSSDHHKTDQGDNDRQKVDTKNSRKKHPKDDHEEHTEEE